MFLYYFFNSKGGRCGWGLEVELKEGKNPEQDGVEVFFFNFFFSGSGGGWRGHTDGKARRKLQSLVQIELCRKINLPDQSPCQKGKPLGIMHRLQLRPTRRQPSPADCSQQWTPAGLQAARRTTAQGSLPQSLSFPPGRSQTQNAALSRRVLNTFHH